MGKIKTSSITLFWTCPECGKQFTSPLDNIVEAGTAICKDCGEECLLDDDVEVQQLP